MNTIAADLLARYERGEICKPCDKALAWLGDRTDMRRAWHDCPRGDWMLWIAQELGHRPPVDWVARESVSYAFGYAAESLDCVPSLASYAAAMRHHRDALRTATPATAGDLLRAAADAAAAAADAAAADAAAARAAARAAALAAARAAAWAAAAAAAAALAAADAAADAAAEYQRCADAVRVLWPMPPWEAP